MPHQRHNPLFHFMQRYQANIIYFFSVNSTLFPPLIYSYFRKDSQANVGELVKCFLFWERKSQWIWWFRLKMVGNNWLKVFKIRKVCKTWRITLLGFNKCSYRLINYSAPLRLLFLTLGLNF